VDDLCVIRSMRTDLPNHEPSLLMMNCGDLRQVRPSFGSWLTYGLGTENQNLPGFIVLCPYGYPVSGTQNWTAGFLPSVYQGTYIDTKEIEVERLIQHIKNNSTSREQQRKQLDLLAALNQRYQKQRQEDSLVEAQIQSYELAFRMQTAIPEVEDLSGESAATHTVPHAFPSTLVSPQPSLTEGFTRTCAAWRSRTFSASGTKPVKWTASATPSRMKPALIGVGAVVVLAILAWFVGSLVRRPPTPLTLVRAEPQTEAVQVAEGKDVAFAAEANGNGPLRYEWTLEGRRVSQEKEWSYKPTASEASEKPKTVKLSISDQAGQQLEKYWQVTVAPANRSSRRTSTSLRNSGRCSYVRDSLRISLRSTCSPSMPRMGHTG